MRRILCTKKTIALLILVSVVFSSGSIHAEQLYTSYLLAKYKNTTPSKMMETANGRAAVAASFIYEKLENDPSYKISLDMGDKIYLAISGYGRIHAFIPKDNSRAQSCKWMMMSWNGILKPREIKYEESTNTTKEIIDTLNEHNYKWYELDAVTVYMAFVAINQK